MGYSLEEIIKIFSLFKRIIRKVHTYKEEKDLAKKIALRRRSPKGDALHAILAKNNEAQLISRDEHFEMLKDITIAKKPEDII